MAARTSLQGRTAVVTGGSRGIGLAIVERFARAGARVMLASARPASVERAVGELRARGLGVAGLACDVADLEQVLALRDAALQELGQIDIWVNNAGVSGPFGATLDVPVAEWRRVIETNLFGTHNGCVAVLPHMVGRGSGMVINLSGGGASRAQRFLSAYSTSKAAIVRFTEALARDYQGHPGLRFAVLAPGMVPTEMITEFATVGEGAEAIRALPRIMRIFGTTSAETAELALRIATARAGRPGRARVYQVMPRRRAIWRLLRAALSGELRKGRGPAALSAERG